MAIAPTVAAIATSGVLRAGGDSLVAAGGGAPEAAAAGDKPGAATPVAASRIASANSPAVLKRSSGRFAIALAMTASNGFGTCTLSRDGGGGSTLSTLCMIVVAVPENGFSPVRNS